MLRRVLRVLVAGSVVLVACGTSDAAAPEAPSTVGDVGVLPDTLPEGPSVPTTELPATTVESAPTSPTSSVSTTEESVPSTTPRVNDGRVSVGRLADGNRVLVIGDSILASISDRYGGQLCAELVPRGWVVEVAAEVGRFVGFGRQVLAEQPPDDWDVAVVMLGNNYDGDPEGYARELGLLLDELQPLPVVLLTVTRFEPQQDEVNWIVTQEAGRRDDVVVLDWATPTANDAAGSSELLTGDGLHLTPEGQQALAERIRRTLGNAPGDGAGECLRSTFRDDSGGSFPGAAGGGGDGGSDRAGTSFARPVTTTVPRRDAPEVPETAAPATTATPVDQGEPDAPDQPDPPPDPPPDAAPDPTPVP